jgi:SAM-dependent methyltransferase
MRDDSPIAASKTLKEDEGEISGVDNCISHAVLSNSSKPRSSLTHLANSYWIWWLYHALFADAVSLQRPTKDAYIYQFLGQGLGRAADIGCGPGVFTRYLCRHAQHVYAGDIDPNSLSRTFSRHAGRGNLTPLVVRANQLPFRDDSLDTVLFLEVLEHLEDDTGAVRELYRVLAPSGKLVLSVPIPPGEVNEGEEWGHKREGYSLGEMKTILEGEGFEVVRHAYAIFKFSRLAIRLVNSWRKSLRVPAPFFVGWVSYFDLLLDAKRRQRGEYEPADLIVLAQKKQAT